ncbi:hypothetical protein K466DRAFT_651222 [Polyporus arcularius HHB13444]|uniref:F-box domain-containing protein n=1 Tax=Polyporus arcularius HHB13444 TaxID=1314778 RepID=A0A5C3PPQ5_9APHY|nr:hypothetical protein K466DRAFT_651222 [Polyporus arcularius HHB13444]
MISATYPTPRLNWDALREVAVCADRSTCATLMLSCRFFYHEAAKSILFNNIRLLGEKDVLRFLQFLQADNGSRFQYARHLTLCSLYGLKAHTAASLIRSMDRMPQLERLSIESGDSELRLYPALADVIAKFTHLRHLDITYAGHVTCALLKSMQSALVSISLNWCDYPRSFFEAKVGRDLLANYHPVLLLARWAPTLEELSCHSWRTGMKVPVFPHVYPRLRVLQIEKDDLPLIAPFIRAFPNLRQLDFRTDRQHADDYDDCEEHALPAEIRQHRQRNIASQLAPNGPGTWQHLENLVGGVADLYLLGLTSQVSAIRLYTEFNAAGLGLLSVVLSYARPLHLKIKGNGALLTHPLRSLAKILHEPWAARLESLSVELHLGEQDGDVDIPSLLHALACTLSQLTMRRLRLNLITTWLDPTPDPPDDFETWMATETHGWPEPRPPSPAPLTPAEVMLQSFDVDAFVRTLGDATPSLQDAVVQVVGPRSSGRRVAVIAKSKIYVDADMDADMSEDPLSYD